MKIIGVAVALALLSPSLIATSCSRTATAANPSSSSSTAHVPFTYNELEATYKRVIAPGGFLGLHPVDEYVDLSRNRVVIDLASRDYTASNIAKLQSVYGPSIAVLSIVDNQHPLGPAITVPTASSS